MPFKHNHFKVGIINISMIKIALLTSLAIISAQFLGTLVVYNFFRFDIYLSLVAAAFLLTGYLLASKKAAPVPETAAIENNTGLKDLTSCLTNREISIFRLIAQGKTNKEIAADLSVELSTVKTHINNLYSKLDCTNRKEARQKWVELVSHNLIS
ncbi:MAG: LuxR C-terminal-related transcriptional regulator [Bacteroidota bacterium]|nr:LuxR C-terminal-related transcriptional regulator [Bacteroidota bacterium]